MPPEETDAKSFFDSVPSSYGGTATLEAPAPRQPETPPRKPDPTPATSADPKKADATPAPAVGADKPESGAADPADDLLADRGEKPVKSPAQYAKERREAKEKKREILEKAPLLEEENQRLKAEFDAAQARLAELEAMTSKERKDQAVSQEDIDTLRARAELAEKRYIAANGPQVDPYQDPEVLRHAREVEDALRANLPKFSLKGDGTRARINIDVLRKSSPERKAAMDQAVAQYAMASEAGDERELDKAVVLMGTALGGLDIEDDEVRTAIETALVAATEPFAKGLARYRHVKDNAVQIAREQRAEQARIAETRLLAPLRLAPEAVDQTLQKNPAHPWANFGKLVEEMPEEFRSTVEESLRRDSSILGALRFTPPPLAPNATAEEIEAHEAIVQAADKTVADAARYIAVGRAMIDGGLLAHLRAKVIEAHERLESEAESGAIPRRESGGSGEGEKSSTIWDNIPNNYRRGS